MGALARIPPTFQLPAKHTCFSLDARVSLRLPFTGTFIRDYLSYWMAKAASWMTSPESNVSSEEQFINLLSQSRLLGLSSLVGFLNRWQLLALRAPDAS